MLRDRFPDRQLFIDLHAHTPGQDPVPPEAALAGLLTAAGVDARYLPEDLEGRAEPVAGPDGRPAGPAGPGQRRQQRPGRARCCLAAGAAWCWSPAAGTWGTCPGRSSRSCWMPCRRIRRRRCSCGWPPAPSPTRQRRCRNWSRLAGYLPLAISLLARVYARHPSWTLADLARETRASLLTLAAEKDSVAAAFEVSYRYLTPGQQQFFRRLGLHPGTTIDAYAAAALAGIPLARTPPGSWTPCTARAC